MESFNCIQVSTIALQIHYINQDYIPIINNYIYITMLMIISIINKKYHTTTIFCHDKL